MKALHLLAVSALLLTAVQASSSTPCVVCTILLGLVEQWLQASTHTMPSSHTAGEVLPVAAKLCRPTDDVCNEWLNGPRGVALVDGVMSGQSPDDTCASLNLCHNATCKLFTTWPVTPQGPRPSPKPWTPPSHDADSNPPAPLASLATFHQVQDAWTPPPVDHVASRLAIFATIVGKLDAAGAATEERGTWMYTLAKAMLTEAVARPAGDAPRLNGLPDPCGANISCIITRVFDNHLPFFDEDGDDFTGSNNNGIFTDGFRGANWRGRDCNDSDPTIYPGRKTTTHPPEVDHNCNGIYGVDPSTGKSWEETLCEGTGQRGLAILGDSATAHFHIPPAWIRGKDWSLTDLLPAAADELDWPQCSWSTGWTNTSDCPAASMKLDSVYQRLRERNLCSHRDFQNIGVNGARSTSMAPPGIIDSFSRDQENDQPLLVFYALIGNDVCNGHPGTGHMTTPSEFYDSVTKSLQHLDTVLPAGSHVLFIPLVDGRILFDTTKDLTHPLGVGYPAVYEYLSCSGDNPCWGWLNTNETWRNITTQHANSLNKQYERILSTQHYGNFDMHYSKVDWAGFVTSYVAAGGIAADLIEPVDGFHPSQSGNMYLAYNVWNLIEKDEPEVLGDINPHNAKIKELFGDQGGYL